MEINITSLLDQDMFPFSHSRAEGGENAGRNTWNASKEHASTIRPPLLSTPEQFQEARDHFKEYGAWSEEEIATWSDNEIQALLLQDIAANVRESPAIIDGVSIYQMDDGEWYFSHESTPDMETGPYDDRSSAYHDAASEHYRSGCYPSADSLDNIDWDEYEVMANRGSISSRIGKGDNGQIYFYIGL